MNYIQQFIENNIQYRKRQIEDLRSRSHDLPHAIAKAEADLQRSEALLAQKKLMPDVDDPS